MPTLKRHQFTETIDAAPEVIWHHTTTLDSYRDWSAEFSAGSTYDGACETGSTIRFTAGGTGMLAIIAESRPHEYIAIRHYGAITDGIEDTTSDAVTAWAPAYETYTLVPGPEGTTMIVDLDMPLEWEGMLLQTWPAALQRLKALSEAGR